MCFVAAPAAAMWAMAATSAVSAGASIAQAQQASKARRDSKKMYEEQARAAEEAANKINPHGAVGVDELEQQATRQVKKPTRAPIYDSYGGSNYLGA